MDDKITISTFQLFKLFPDQEAARVYLESRLWPNGARCPVCGLGVYHHASDKHLRRYVDEFTFRLNDGNVKQQTLERLNSLIAGTVGRRITYAQLTA